MQIYYPRPMLQQPTYRVYGNSEGSLLVAEALSQQALAQPMHSCLDEAIFDMICDSVRGGLD